jgi:hypothetical protein
MTAAKEISGYKLDSVGVQEIRRGRGGIYQQGSTHLSSKRGMKNKN